MRVPFGVGAYRRDAGNFAEIKCINMFAEKSPTSEGEVALIGRWGLQSSASRGSGPVHAVMWKSGVFGGDMFTLSGGTLYRGGTALGAIDGFGPVSFAFSDLELVVTQGASAWSYNGTDLEAIDFPDGANVRAVAFVAGMFVFVRDGSGRFYWSAVLDARTIGALDYATAESSPDPLRDVVVMRGNLYLLGASTIEVWFATGALDLPFTRVDQRLYPIGVMATGCAREMDNTLFIVGSDGVAYRLEEVAQRLSDHGIEERIGQSTACSAFVIEYQGHKFFCIRLVDQGAWLYDAATGEWCEFASYGRDNWRAQCAVALDRTIYLGDDETGTVWTFTDTPQDGEAVVEARWSAGFRIDGGTVSLDSLQVEANVGWTQFLEGQGSAPQIEMRTSRDAGATFGSWRSANLGRQGRYRNRARWTRLGMFDHPGALIEFRITDPSPRRVSGVRANEAGGGRSR
jgi:Phage stabilisation protein